MMHKTAENAKGWRSFRLDELVAIPKSDIVDGPFGSNLKASEYTESGVPIARLQNVDPNIFVRKNIRFVSEEKATELSRHNFKPGDLLITKLGDPLGEACIVPPDIERGVIVADLVRVRLDPARCVRDVVCYAINSSVAQAQFKRETKGTTRPRVNLEMVRSLKLPLPKSLDEQQCIVAEIEKQFTQLDAGIASLKRVQAALKRYRASVLKAACEGRLVSTEAELARKENRSYETGEELLQRILKERRVKWNGKGKYKEPTAPKPTSHPDLPEGWVWTGFEQLADGTKHAIKAGPFGSSLKKSVYTTTGFKIYGQEQVIRGDPYFGDYFISRELFEQLQSCEAKPGDILMSLVGTAGRVLILPSGCTPGIINPRLLKLSLNRSGVNPMFIKILLESATARVFFKLAAHGGTMEILNLGILKALPVPLPPIAEQTRIVAEVERRLSVVEELTDVVSANQRRAVGFRQSVLRQAFSGRLSLD
jgi:type I restriction enzyme, S subunit